MKEMKYIVVRRKSGEVSSDHIFVFDKSFNHDFFYEAVTRLRVGTRANWTRGNFEVLGAGFTDGVECWGESITLGVKSRGAEDAYHLTL